MVSVTLQQSQHDHKIFTVHFFTTIIFTLFRLAMRLLPSCFYTVFKTLSD